MKDSFFWRVIGVGLVVGLFMIGYGLCKNSQISAPSFSSAAYAEDAKPEKEVSEKSVAVKPILIFKDLTLEANTVAFYEGIRRAKVPGGWLLTLRKGGSDSFAFTFYPDPKHQWDGGSLE